MFTTQLKIASLGNLRHRLDLLQENAAKLGLSVRTSNEWENRQVLTSPLAMEKIIAILQALGNFSADVTNKGKLYFLAQRLNK